MLLDKLVGREAAVGDAEVHRAARGDDADAELPGRLHLGLDEPGAAAREDVMVVEHRRAPGQRELCEARARRGVFRLRVDRRPHRIQLAQPREQVGLLRPCPCQGLVQVVVRVDEPGRDDGAGEVDTPVGHRLGPVADRRDRRAVDEHPAVGVLGAGVVHRDDPGACVERRHDGPGCDSRSPASVCRTNDAFAQNSSIAAAST